MSDKVRPSFGRRVYMALFQVMGPADVKPVGPPAAHNPDDPTVPQGYHLETFTRPDGIKKRIMVADSSESESEAGQAPER